MNEQWQEFLNAGLPGRSHEHWKYHDLAFLAKQKFTSAKKINLNEIETIIHQHRLHADDAILMVLVNGYFCVELSDLARLPQGVVACNTVSENVELIDAGKYPFAHFNHAASAEELFIHVHDDCHLAQPIHLLSLSVGENDFMAHPRTHIVLGKNAEATLLEEYFSASSARYLMNTVTHIHLDNSARLHHYKIQHEGLGAIHFANHVVHQKQASHFAHVNVSDGATLARDDMVIKLLETGASCETSGFYHLRSDQQTIDNHVDIQHAAKHSQSEMLYKGIMEKQSRAIFNGRLLVEKDAQKITAYQANHNLLLSKNSEVYSKPELEIYADDVKCKHGATTGQINQDALFYLQSRGIRRAEAVNILLTGFADEILQRIKNEDVRFHVKAVLLKNAFPHPGEGAQRADGGI